MRESRAWRSTAALLPLLIAAVLPSSSFGSTELARAYLIDEPDLAGGQVFFMTAWREDGYAIRVVGPGISARTAARGREAGKAESRSYSFDAAVGRVGVEGSRIHEEGDSGTSDPSAGVTYDYHDSRLLVGERAAALAPVAECSGQGTFFPYAVGALYVAFVDDCPGSELVDPGSPRLRYLDFAAAEGRRRTIRLSGGRFMTDEYRDRLSISGHWAAVDASIPNAGTAPPYESPITVVLDLAAGRESYRVDRFRDPVAGPSGGAAIDSDGTLVTASGAMGDECEGTLAFHTPANPEPHPLPGRACAARLDIDQGNFIFIGDSGDGPAVMAGDIAASAPRTVALVDPELVRGVGIEARQVAFGLATCGGATSIHLASLDERPSDLRESPRCPVRLASRRMTLHPGGRGALRLECPRGCDVRAALRVARQTANGPRLRTIAYGHVASRGPTARLRFELPPRARSMLPRGVRAARVELVSVNLAGRNPTIRVPIRLRVG
jgi:hypothetical protein